MKKSKGFSLIELIAAMAIVGVIGALFVNSLQLHKEVERVAKTRTQFSEYESAIRMYCKEYGDWPAFFADEELICLSGEKSSTDFVKILSGKGPNGEELADDEREAYNPKAVAFHTFSPNEFFLKNDGTRDFSKLADAYNNQEIYIIVESPFDDNVVISKNKFPEVVRKNIKGDGVNAQIVIFSIVPGTNRVVSNCLEICS